MDGENEKVNGQENPNPEGNPVHTNIANHEGTAKKVVKTIIKGLVIVATGVVGFFLGRASKDGDSEETGSTEEKAAE